MEGGIDMQSVFTEAISSTDVVECVELNSGYFVSIID
jgi:hypothetical protein